MIFAFELVVFTLTQFTLWPEIVLYPWLNNNSFLLYKDIINPYFPLLTWILSLANKIFGYNLQVFIIFTWGYIFLSQVIFIYSVQKLFNNKKITALSLLIYAALSVIFEVNGLWFDLTVTLPLLLVFYTLLKKKYLLAGIFLGISLLIKQTVIWSIVGSIFYIVVTTLKLSLPKKIKNIFYLLFPILAFLLLLLLFFYRQGIFSDFLFWAVKLPFGILQKTPGFIELPTKRNVLIMLITFWPIIVFIPRILKDKISTLSLIFFISTFVFAFPRFGYFHLVAAVPFFSILAAKIFSNRKFIGLIYLFSIAIMLIIIVKRTSPFSIRFFGNDTYKLAKMIKQETKGERYFLQNSSQQIYFINNILPPKPWAINFRWYLENNNLQPRIISGINANQIQWVALENYQISSNPNSPGSYKPKILQQFIDQNYEQKKIINNIQILKRKY